MADPQPVPLAPRGDVSYGGVMITVPPTFVAMPRWWQDPHGRAWLSELPPLVEAWCSRWNLQIDGEPMHGSNALVVPVLSGDEPLALRLAPPGDDVVTEARALRIWDGRGVVQLKDAAEDEGVMLLERLDGSRTLLTAPLDEAVRILAELTLTLAIPVPTDILSTRDIAGGLAETMESDWAALNGPTPRYQLIRAVGLAEERAGSSASNLAVNGDLHFEQVLAGRRAPWIVVDPVLLRGDPEYDLARILWTRLDEKPRDNDVRALFGSYVGIAGVPAERARSWVVLRSMSYLLWGLPRGLTYDPAKCRRLLDIFC